MNKFLVFIAVLLVTATLWASHDTQSEPDMAPIEFVDAEFVSVDTKSTAPVQLVYTEVTEPEQPAFESRYIGLSLSEEDVDLLAKIIWLESRGECFEGQQAVAEVVLNRMMSTAFPDTLEEVIYQKGQFTTAKNVVKAVPTETQYQAIFSALTGPNVLPLDVVFFATTAENDNVWGTIGGHTFCYPYYWGD